MEYQGEVWVVTGDYKLEDDALSGAWEPVKCHTLVTESTFGLPIYQWRPQQEIFAGIKNWVKQNQAANRSSLLLAYSLGKAQRILKPLAETTDHILVHGAIWNTHQTLLNAGWKLPAVRRVIPEMNRNELKGCVVIAPPGAADTPWSKRFGPLQTGICSGWMQVRGHVRRRNVDAGFALSDHCDWPSLLKAIKETEATRIYVTHGFQSELSRYLNDQGLEAYEVKTEFGLEEERGDEGIGWSEPNTPPSA
jgi:putative mRNA 3-end processing factor